MRLPLYRLGRLRELAALKTGTGGAFGRPNGWHWRTMAALSRAGYIRRTLLVPARWKLTDKGRDAVGTT